MGNFQNLSAIALSCVVSALFLLSGTSRSWAQTEIPVDLFVFADQSKSILQLRDERSQADDIVGVIREVLEARGDGDSGQTMLSGGGQFALFGFAGKSDTTKSCSNDVRVISALSGDLSTDRIDQAFNDYRSSGSGAYDVTNFVCLFEDIRNRPEIQASLASNRQTVVFIASDFLHDATNSSVLDTKDPDNAALEYGICPLLNQFYRQGNLPADLAEKLPDLPTREKMSFGLLRVAYSGGGSARYRPCAENTASAGTNSFAGILEKNLSARLLDYGSDDAPALVSSFREFVDDRLGGIVITRVELDPLSTDQQRVLVSFRAAGSQRIYVIDAETKIGGTTYKSVGANGPPRPLEPGSTGTITLQIPWERAKAHEEANIVVNFKRSTSKNAKIDPSASYTVAFRSPVDIRFARDEPVLLAPKADGSSTQLELALENLGQRVGKLIRADLTVDGQKLPIEGLNEKDITTGDSTEFSVPIPDELARILTPTSRVDLEIRVDDPGSEGNIKDLRPDSVGIKQAPTIRFVGGQRKAGLTFQRPGSSTPKLTLSGLASTVPGEDILIESILFDLSDGEDRIFRLLGREVIDGRSDIASFEAELTPQKFDGMDRSFHRRLAVSENVQVSLITVTGQTVDGFDLRTTFDNLDAYCPSQGNLGNFVWKVMESGQVSYSFEVEFDDDTYRLPHAEINAATFNGEPLRVSSDKTGDGSGRKVSVELVFENSQTVRELARSAGRTGSIILRNSDFETTICDFSVPTKDSQATWFGPVYEVLGLTDNGQGIRMRGLHSDAAIVYEPKIIRLVGPAGGKRQMEILGDPPILSAGSDAQEFIATLNGEATVADFIGSNVEILHTSGAVVTDMVSIPDEIIPVLRPSRVAQRNTDVELKVTLAGAGLAETVDRVVLSQDPSLFAERLILQVQGYSGLSTSFIARMDQQSFLSQPAANQRIFGAVSRFACLLRPHETDAVCGDSLEPSSRWTKVDGDRPGKVIELVATNFGKDAQIRVKNLKFYPVELVAFQLQAEVQREFFDLSVSDINRFIEPNDTRTLRGEFANDLRRDQAAELINHFISASKPEMQLFDGDGAAKPLIMIDPPRVEVEQPTVRGLLPPFSMVLNWLGYKNIKDVINLQDDMILGGVTVTRNRFAVPSGSVLLELLDGQSTTADVLANDSLVVTNERPSLVHTYTFAADLPQAYEAGEYVLRAQFSPSNLIAPTLSQPKLVPDGPSFWSWNLLQYAAVLMVLLATSAMLLNLPFLSGIPGVGQLVQDIRFGFGRVAFIGVFLVFVPFALKVGLGIGDLIALLIFALSLPVFEALRTSTGRLSFYFFGDEQMPRLSSAEMNQRKSFWTSGVFLVSLAVAVYLVTSTTLPLPPNSACDFPRQEVQLQLQNEGCSQ